MDTIAGEVGEGGQGVAVGKNIRQRIRRNSPNVVVNLTDSLRSLESELLQLQVDIKLLHNMAEERRDQVYQLQSKVDSLGAALLLMGVAALVMALCFAFFVIMVWR